MKWACQIGCSILISVGVAFLLMHFSIPASFGVDVIKLVGNVSVTLFGVFGIWLGFCFHGDVKHKLEGKIDAELKKEAQIIWRNAERTRVLFQGLAISTLLFILSILCQLIIPIFGGAVTFRLGHSIVYCLKFTLFFTSIQSVLLQIYSLFSTVAVMADTYRETIDAQDHARKIMSYK